MEVPKDIKIRELEAEFADSKNSSYSSKPPKTSNKNSKKPKRKQGAQKGRECNLRVEFSSDQIDEARASTLSNCTNCGGDLSSSETSYKISQQIELVEKPFRVVEYCRQLCRCKERGKTYCAPLPAGTFLGLFDPKLKALVIWMKGA